MSHTREANECDDDWQTRGEKRDFHAASVGGGGGGSSAVVNDGGGKTGSVGQYGGDV